MPRTAHIKVEEVWILLKTPAGVRTEKHDETQNNYSEPRGDVPRTQSGCFSARSAVGKRGGVVVVGGSNDQTAPHLPRRPHRPDPSESSLLHLKSFKPNPTRSQMGIPLALPSGSQHPHFLLSKRFAALAAEAFYCGGMSCWLQLKHPPRGQLGRNEGKGILRKCRPAWRVQRMQNMTSQQSGG